jgi:two-component system, NarL family, nitrate/nitrite response regulator NarL
MTASSAGLRSVPGAAPELRARAIVVGDDPGVRDSIGEAMREVGLTVIAAEADGRQGVELALHYKPDMVVLDASMHGIDGLEALRRIHAQLPSTRVIILSPTADPKLGVLALRRGAAGFLIRDEVTIAKLGWTLLRALEGEIACSRSLVANIVLELRRLPDDGIGIRPVHSPLTQREWEVLDYMCLGWSTARIAENLVLSTDTVRSHIKNLMRKLGTKSREEAVRLAARERAGTGTLAVADGM